MYMKVAFGNYNRMELLPYLIRILSRVLNTKQEGVFHESRRGQCLSPRTAPALSGIVMYYLFGGDYPYFALFRSYGY